MKRILCIGGAVVDFVFYLDELPRRAEKYGTESAAIVGGGCAANAAVAVTRLGGSAVLAARLGDDRVGDMILSDLVAEGVDVADVTRTRGAQSAYSSVYIDSQGERQIVNYRGTGLVLDTDWFADLKGLGAVLADTRRVRAAVAGLELARSQNLPGIVDGEMPIDPAILDAASHVAFSEQGLRSVVPEYNRADPGLALERIAMAHGCWVCVTAGAKGVWFLGDQGLVHVPSFAIDAVDTLGAGDIWHGAFAQALSEGQKELAAIQFANATAALKCTRPGGRLGCPDRAVVDEFLKENT